MYIDAHGHPCVCSAWQCQATNRKGASQKVRFPCSKSLQVLIISSMSRRQYPKWRKGSRTNTRISQTLPKICLWCRRCPNLGRIELMYRGLNEWPIFCRRHLQMNSHERKFCILMQIPPNVVQWGLINNGSTLVPAMACRLPGDKPLSEPMLT